MTRALALVLALAARTAAAEPCDDAVADPAPTPVHDVGLDAQRSACLRGELASALTAHALVDTPGFHGVLGGELALAARAAVAEHVELGARLRVVDYAFVQTAVNKVTAARFGPLALAAAVGRTLDGAHVAVAATAELPYTRDDMATTHAGGELTALVTTALAERWILHARLGALAAVASSDGGTTRRLALRAGADVGRRFRRATLLAGAESQAGWYGGLDAVIARAGLQFRPARAWRGLVGLAVPLAGDDRTTAIFALGIARDLH